MFPRRVALAMVTGEPRQLSISAALHTPLFQGLGASLCPPSPTGEAQERGQGVEALVHPHGPTRRHVAPAPLPLAKRSAR